MPLAYAVVTVTVTDQEKYAEYGKLASPAVAKFGGRFLVRGGRTAVLEGELEHPRVALIEFPSFEQAQAFYDSAEYAAARAKRVGAAVFNFVLVEGVA